VTEQAYETPEEMSERRLPALAVSRGIGIGRIFRMSANERRPARFDLRVDEVDAEIHRFRSALDAAKQRLHKITTGGELASHDSTSDIFRVHLLILESSFSHEIEELIKSRKVNAEWAVKVISDRYRESQNTVSDEALREKSLDIGDVADRLFKALGVSSTIDVPPVHSVVLARELSPSMVIELAKTSPCAVITELGGWTSHASIVAREMNIPMVCGVRDLDDIVSADERVLVDGNNGEVIITPREETVAEFMSVDSLVPRWVNNELQNVDRDRTADGVSFIIRANIDHPDSYCADNGRSARGVGLFRSESLIDNNGHIPTEDEQVEAYIKIAEAAGDHRVRIRTFDIDRKRIDTQTNEHNPALGLRAIRLSLTDPRHFRAQVRAILRAAHGRKIDIILPMVSGVEDVVRAKEMIAEEKQQLAMAGCKFGTPAIGAMIETPSSIFTSFEIAQRVDFLCLGTNDLVQYLLAVDRDNDAVTEWYQTLHPAVIRAISEVLCEARRADRQITLCGEMAGSPFYAPVLLGLGAREFSMTPKSIPSIRHLLSAISVEDAMGLVAKIRSLETAVEAETYLEEFYSDNWAVLFPPNFLDATFARKDKN
jgi:phosphotransferase system enzyme I (PtsI)